MKYYTLAEHRTFCIESGIPNGEVWHEVAKLGWLPKGIYHSPDQAFNPEIKLKQRKRQKDYASIPEYQARKKSIIKSDTQYLDTGQRKKSMIKSINHVS